MLFIIWIQHAALHLTATRDNKRPKIGRGRNNKQVAQSAHQGAAGEEQGLEGGTCSPTISTRITTTKAIVDGTPHGLLPCADSFCSGGTFGSCFTMTKEEEQKEFEGFKKAKANNDSNIVMVISQNREKEFPNYRKELWSPSS